MEFDDLRCLSPLFDLLALDEQAPLLDLRKERIPINIEMVRGICMLSKQQSLPTFGKLGSYVQIIKLLKFIKSPPIWTSLTCALMRKDKILKMALVKCIIKRKHQGQNIIVDVQYMHMYDPGHPLVLSAYSYNNSINHFIPRWISLYNTIDLSRAFESFQTCILKSIMFYLQLCRQHDVDITHDLLLWIQSNQWILYMFKNQLILWTRVCDLVGSTDFTVQILKMYSNTTVDSRSDINSLWGTSFKRNEKVRLDHTSCSLRKRCYCTLQFQITC